MFGVSRSSTAGSPDMDGHTVAGSSTVVEDSSIDTVDSSAVGDNGTVVAEHSSTVEDRSIAAASNTVTGNCIVANEWGMRCMCIWGSADIPTVASGKAYSTRHTDYNPTLSPTQY